MKWILQILTLFYPKQYFIPKPDELNEMNPANANPILTCSVHDPDAGGGGGEGQVATAAPTGISSL